MAEALLDLRRFGDPNAGIEFRLFCAVGAISSRGNPMSPVLAKIARRAEIIRDNSGVRYVNAKTDVDTVFVLLGAQAEEDLLRIEENEFRAIGPLG
ncbi:MAG: hypothetical protein HN453_12575 [Gammaproteobacteria bacterium]|nr:hypothetical protein [Gammaproteobacteria bacterium]